MKRPPGIGLVIMMMLGISGCAGAPQRLMWSSASAPAEDRADSPARPRFSWWNRAGSRPAGAEDRKQDLAQSSPARSQPKETSETRDIWHQERSPGLARFFPSFNRRSNSPENRRDPSQSRSVAKKPSDDESDTDGDALLHASRPVTRFRDVVLEPEANESPRAVAVAESPAPTIASFGEGGVLRASLPPQGRAASRFGQGTVPQLLPALQSSIDYSKATSPIPVLEPAPAQGQALPAMSANSEPDNLLPQSLMRDSDGPPDSSLSLAAAQDQAPSSKATSTPAKTQKPSSKPASSPPQPPNPRPTPLTPAPSSPAPSAEPKKSTTAPKPAADQMKLQSPEIEPAAAIQQAPSATQVKPVGPKNVVSEPSPPEPPAPEASPPAASGPTPAASGPEPATTGSASAGYAQVPTAQGAPREFLTSPSLAGTVKTVPSAQLPTPLFSQSYDWSTPAPAAQVLPAPQAGCCECCPTKVKKCRLNLEKCILIRKLKCVMQFIHEHCPLKKKFWKKCCQDCPCCGPTYIGTMASPPAFFGSLQSAPISMPASGSPATPQTSRFFAPPDRKEADLGPDSVLALEPSTGPKANDFAQAGDDLKPIAPQGLDQTP
jgi:hypothetical protein